MSKYVKSQIPRPRQSPSSRRAWIEIGKAGRNLSRAAVALLAEGVDRNHTVCLWRCFRGVALLAEGVDRNLFFARCRCPARAVALLAEGVDRNNYYILLSWLF